MLRLDNQFFIEDSETVYSRHFNEKFNLILQEKIERNTEQLSIALAPFKTFI